MDFSLNKFLILILIGLVKKAYSGALKLNTQNYDSTLSSHELVMVNYYANWCRFSQMLEPIYDEFADKAAKDIPAGKVVVGKVDCDTESTIASQNQINKYPSLKLYRYGTAVKKEYRGQRTADSFLAYLKEQLESPIKIAKNYAEYSNVFSQVKKRMLIGYFQSEDNENFKTFSKLASILRDSCSFIAGIGEVTSTQRENLEQISFKENLEQTEIPYSGELNQYEALYAWANEKCTPLVREITFENAEELTEEGLPFLILFHKPDDTESVRTFENEVKRQLGHVKSTINCVYADGLKFSHPLHHLGKSSNDLPILAIDSFRHMYLFPDYNKMIQGENLLHFVQDLHSGKLHREFHNGPDPTLEPPKADQIELVIGNQQHIPKLSDNQGHNNNNKQSTPPESVFIKLAPSRERYSIKYEGEL